MFDKRSIFGTNVMATAEPALVGPSLPVDRIQRRSIPVTNDFRRQLVVPSIVQQLTGMGAVVLGTRQIPMGGRPRPPWPEQIRQAYAGFGALNMFG